MQEQDVTEVLTGANLTPDEASKNLVNSTAIGVEPDTYSSMKSTLQPIAENIKSKPVATPRVAETISKSSTVASIAKPDLKNMNTFEKYWNYMGDVLKSGDINRERNKLAFDVMLGDHDEQKMFNLTNLQDKLDQVQTDKSKYDYSFGESLPAESIGAGVDYIKGLYDNLHVIGGTSAAYALPAAVTGFGVAGVPGATAAGVYAAGSGALTGAFAAGIWDSYKQSAGGIYSELSLSKDAPANLTEDQKVNLAKGAGFIVGAINMVGDAAIAKTVPWLGKSLAPRSFVKAITRPENRRWFDMALKLGASETVNGFIKSGAIGGASQALQDTVHVVAEEMGKRSNGTELSFMDGLNALTQSHNVERIAKSAAMGATGAVQFHGVMAGAGKVVNAVKGTNAEQSILVEQPSQPVEHPVSDLVGLNSTLPTVNRGTRALQLNVLLAEGANLENNIKFKELAPNEMAQLRKRIVEDAGVPHVWVDPEELNNWANTDEKAAKARRILGGSILESGLQAPIRIETDKFMELAHDDLKVAGIAKVEPEDMSADQYVKLHEEKKAKGQELLSGMQKRSSELENAATRQMAEGIASSNNADVHNIEIAQLDNQINALKSAQVEDAINVLEPHIPQAVQQYRDTLSDIKLLQDESIKYPFEGLKTVNIKDEGGAIPINSEEQRQTLLTQLQQNAENDLHSIIKSTPRVLDKLESKKDIATLKETFLNRDKSSEIDDSILSKPVETLTPTEATKLQAQGDLYLKEFSNKKRTLSNDELKNLVVTRERADWLQNEIHAELADDQAKEYISKAVEISNMDDVVKAFSEAQPGEVKLKDGRTLTMTPEADHQGYPTLLLSVDGKNAGSIKVKTERQHGKQVPAPAMTFVEPEFRRKGVASSAYEYIRANIVKLEHSYIQTEMGKAFTKGSKEQGIGVFATNKLEKLQGISKQLAEIRDSLPSHDDGRIRDADIMGEQSYLDQPTFSKAIEGVLSETEKNQINKAQQEARQSVVNAISDAAKHEMNQIVDYTERIAMEAERENQAQALENDPHIQTVEDFQNGNIIGLRTPEMEARLEKGHPAVSIDPRTLPKELQNRFKDDVVLNKRKVFNQKSGLHIDEVLAMYGQHDAAIFLDILSKTPTREMAIEQAAELRRGEIRSRAEESVNLNETAIAKAYNDMAKNHLNELKVIREKFWPAFVKGVKRVALPLPNIAEINVKAINAIKDTPVKALNVNQFKVGERKAQKRAVEAILKNEVESAYANKEAAILNTQLAKQVHIAIGEVNRSNERIAQVMSEQGQKALKSAGKQYLDAVNDILGTFNFDPSKNNQADMVSYHKFVERMVSEGKGDMKIPESQFDKYEGKISAHDLTVEEYNFLADKMHQILTVARDLNKLRGEYLHKQEQITVKSMEEVIRSKAQEHPDYNPDKAVNAQGVISPTEKVTKWFNQAGNLFKNMQWITVRLDNGDRNGLFSKIIFDPLKGIGDFNDGANGHMAALSWNAEIENKYKQAIKDYGHREYFDMGIKEVDVPEFKNSRTLKNGKLTKRDLFTMAMHMGNEYNRKQLQNFGVSIETISKVLERELTLKDMKFIQDNVWGTFKAIQPRLKAAEILRKGAEPQWTISRPFEFQGEQFEGGHMPIKYLTNADMESNAQSLREKFDIAAGTKLGGIKDFEPLHGIVSSPHTKERTGGDWVINLDPITFQQGVLDIVYDVSMWQPVKEVYSLLTNKSIAHDIQSIIGQEGYNTLVNHVAESTRSFSSNAIDLYNDHQKFINKAVGTLQGAQAITLIGGNIRSVVRQADSMRYALNAMGLQSGGKHIVTTAAKILNPANYRYWGEFYNVAAEIDPSLKAVKENLDNVNQAALTEFIPHKRMLNNRPYHWLKSMQESANHIFFNKLLGTVDVMQKMVTSIAAYNQFVNGEAPHQDLDAHAKMTPQEMDTAAKAYAAKVNSSALTSGSQIDRASIQKIMPISAIAQYWNDGRNALNTNIQNAHDIKNNYKKAIDLAHKGDWEGFNLALSDTGDTAMRQVFLAGLGLKFGALVGGLLWSQTDESDESIKQIPPMNDETGLAWMSRLGYNLTEQEFLQHTPIVRDMTYAAENGKDPSTPLHKVFNDATKTGSTGARLLYDWMQGLELTEALDGVSDKERKAMASTLSIAVGGLPINAGFNYYNYLTDENNADTPLVGNMKALVQSFLSVANDFIDRHGKNVADMTEEEMFQYLAEKEKHATPIEQAVDETKKLVSQLAPTPQNKESTSLVSNEDFEAIRYAESGGDTQAQPMEISRDNNGNIRRDIHGKPVMRQRSSAYGSWQMVQDTWASIVSQHPEAHLPENIKDATPEQQDMAMRFLMESNAQYLKKHKIKIDAENLYGAHHFGAPDWVKISSASDSTDKEDVVSSAAFRANPWLNSSKIQTAKDVKNKISSILETGRKKYQASLK